MKISLALVSALLLLGGCSTTLKPTTLDPKTGYFPTTSKLPPDGVKEQKPYDAARYTKMLYVKTDEKNNEYNTFFLNSFKNMNTFEKVADKKDLEALVIEKQLTDKVSNVSDMIGLNNLQKQIGPFLVVEPYVEWKGGYNFEASLKAIDPETGATALHLHNTAFNWSGLDGPLFFPLMNGFMEWTQGKTISTANRNATTSTKKKK